MQASKNPAAIPVAGQRGFTLLEAVIVIAITGIIGAVVAVFIQAPVKGYFDAVRRAELTDTADTALRRMSRDLRLALPNSIRLADGQVGVEFLLTRTGGRYRAQQGASGDNPLDFTEADTSFDILGPALTLNSGDQLVIYNLGIPGADAYEGNTLATHVRRAVNIPSPGASVTSATVNLISTQPFPFESPGSTFHIVEGPVSYICDLASGTLRRYWGYGFHPAAVTDTISKLNSLLASSGGSAVLAQNVTSCVFSYAPGITERSGLVAMRIAIGKEGENATLYQEVHVSNVP